ncbi:Zn-dependent protease (includes SpoIVFB) [Pelosinus fermentans]|uniref:Peptidase M50 n=1 Tax=Pelosinus fermentans B4 TaxID=1149862 RepID=I9LDQ7_9FIRM|nr:MULTISPECIES: site-2 protease family protein [Pelosinus]EIW18471.1 peptidase M50 [Pelosinus fermentans B4]OAM94457.1 peptidase M50 [Pelosinus fermentans DSM 17108]SDR09628.1 Zn-dependent protease (includes SpoIVFB) [Pelosinus fermentans]
MFGFDENMIFRIPALLIALTIHEYAHARVAVWMGDNTPKMMGRLTLNPISHLDPFGLIMLWLFKFGWAKPVPINPNNFENWRKGTLLVAIAGPVSNVIMALMAAILYAILAKMQLLSTGLAMVLNFTYSYNIIFAVFNMIPLPPLDGSKVLMNILPTRHAYMLEKIEPYAPFILMALVLFNVIHVFITPFYNAISFFINQIVKIIF